MSYGFPSLVHLKPLLLYHCILATCPNKIACLQTLTSGSTSEETQPKTYAILALRVPIEINDYLIMELFATCLSAPVDIQAGWETPWGGSFNTILSHFRLQFPDAFQPVVTTRHNSGQ